MRSSTSVRSRVAYLAALFGAALPFPAAAGSIIDRLRGVGEQAGYAEGTDVLSLASIIGGIIQATLALVGVVFVAQLVFAGYLWMTARDESDSIDKAKHIIRRSIVGLAIVLSAWAITEFVVSRFLEATKVV